jgi:hypothetical protein
MGHPTRRSGRSSVDEARCKVVELKIEPVDFAQNSVGDEFRDDKPDRITLNDAPIGLLTVAEHLRHSAWCHVERLCNRSEGRESAAALCRFCAKPVELAERP